MKAKVSTKGPLPSVLAGIGTGCICIMAGPIGLLVFPFLRWLAKKDVANAVDEVSVNEVGKIVRSWNNNKRPGETTLQISRTIGSGGLINLPMTREYTFWEKENDTPKAINMEWVDHYLQEQRQKKQEED